MNLLKRNLLAAMLLTAFAFPAAVLADVVADRADASEPAAAMPSERMELMQTMRARMHEMMQNKDPAKRKALMEAQAKDMDTLAQMGPPGGMNMMMGPGGRMMGPGMKADCHSGLGGDRPRRDDASHQRLDALEKRVDMMQMMMQMMLNH